MNGNWCCVVTIIALRLMVPWFIDWGVPQKFFLLFGESWLQLECTELNMVRGFWQTLHVMQLGLGVVYV